MKNHIENKFFQDLMVEIFIINQLMAQLKNMTKLGKYQQDMVMIILLVVYQIFLILKKVLG